MIKKLDKEQQAAARRQLLTDVVWAICNDTLRRLLHEGRTQLAPVEVFMSARAFCDTLLALPDIDEGIEYEMDDLEAEAAAKDDAMLVVMLASVQLQAIGRRHVGANIPKIILRLYERYGSHDLFLPLLQGFSHKEEARWLEGKRTDLMNYELLEIEMNGGGTEEKTAFVQEQVDVVLELNNPKITESCLTVLGNLNIKHNHAFDGQILRLYEKLGVPKISITNNHYAEGSNNQVFNGMIKDSSIISK